MNEKFKLTPDYNLQEFLRHFPISDEYQVPVLSKENDLLELHYRLSPPRFRLLGKDKTDLSLQKIHDQFTPTTNFGSYERPYCDIAEGTLNDFGWNAIVSQLKLKEVSCLNKVTIRRLIYKENGELYTEAVHHSKKIAIKHKADSGISSIPSGIYFSKGKPYICSPIVVAVWYDDNNQPKFIYDIKRPERKKDHSLAPGFVWEIRPANLMLSTKIKLQLHLLFD